MRKLSVPLVAMFALVAPAVPQNAWTTFGYPILTEHGDPATEQTSLIAILSDRDTWDGELVQIEGWFRAYYASAGLYISSEYCVRQTMQYGIRVDYSAVAEEMEPWYRSDCTFASVQGRFRALPSERQTLPPGVSDFPPIAPPPGLIEAQYLSLEPDDRTE